MDMDYATTLGVNELLSEVGDHKRYSVHYDRSGRSEGTTEIVFARREDVVSAVSRYNNFQLDGKPLKIEIVGTNIAMSLLENLTVPINYTKIIVRFKVGLEIDVFGDALLPYVLKVFCNLLGLDLEGLMDG
ncbi:THO complex [Salix suchowensis]|nr:THO complex [Salix suchowensis]